MSDENTFTGRVKRYAQVTTAVGGLAARLAGERYLGLNLDRDRHAADLKVALGGLKGPLMKVAQLLSTIPDALPREYVDELAQLQSNAPAMGWPFVKRRMTAELGPDWPDKFAHFEPVAAAAASLGQVHRATGHDGKALAVKLQYPEMAATVEADLRQLKLIFSLYERYDKAISTGDIHAEIADRLREELDYRREGQSMRLYRAILHDEPNVSVPEYLPELSSERALTMSWLDGAPIRDFFSRDPELRNQVAYNMFRAWYVPLYYYGVIHGDPHLGNYSVRPDGALNLLDFGCIRVFQPAFVEGVIELYHALLEHDDPRAVHAYSLWGFTDLSKETVAILNKWASFIYAPLMEDRVRHIQDVNTARSRELAEEVYGALKSLGGVKPPRAFVFMDRAALGLGSVFTHLKAEINWYRLFQELIKDFDVKILAERQRAALATAGLDIPLL